jgi:hypothetical protein
MGAPRILRLALRSLGAAAQRTEQCADVPLRQHCRARPHEPLGDEGVELVLSLTGLHERAALVTCTVTGRRVRKSAPTAVRAYGSSELPPSVFRR